jgi:chromosome partitioning protein
VSARIVAVVNQKGGSSKTTLSIHLAGTLARRGIKSLIVDADPQGTSTRWASSAPDAALFPAAVLGLSAAGEKVHREIAKFKDDYEAIIIDCPPSVDSPIPKSALLIADLALIPLIPSPLDLWSSVGIKKLIEEISSINDGLQARLVITQLEPRTMLTREVLDILQDFGIPRLQTALCHRTAYRQSAVFGGTVHNLRNKATQAIQEVEALTDEVLKIIRM